MASHVCGRDSCVVTLVDPGFHLVHAPVCDILVFGHALLVVEGSINELIDVACDQDLVFQHKSLGPAICGQY